MKHGISHKNTVEIDSLQAYFYLRVKFSKTLYLICQVKLFCVPKIGGCRFLR